MMVFIDKGQWRIGFSYVDAMISATDFEQILGNPTISPTKLPEPGKIMRH
jgi:hypothetical protein